MHEIRPGVADSLLTSVILGQATMLARRGRLEQAGDMLQPLVDRGEATVAVVDLLARIRAQQGQVEEARRLWESVLARAPGHRGARQALERCTRLRKPGNLSPWYWVLGVLVKPLGVILIVAALALTGVVGSRLAGELRALRQMVDRLEEQSVIALSEQRTTGVPRRTLEQAAHALQAEPRLKPFPLHVEADGECVRIVGEVPTYSLRYLAEQVVTQVPGVRRVDLRYLRLSRTYRVMPGDSLWSVSDIIYKDPSRWRELAEANRIRDAHRLLVGQELLVPN